MEFGERRTLLSGVDRDGRFFSKKIRLKNLCLFLVPPHAAVMNTTTPQNYTFIFADHGDRNNNE
jgi:hypothetical protein